MLKRAICAAVAALAIAPAAFAAQLGDPAAPLSIKEWVKGEPVNLAEGKGKNIYVVEFWATWCGPCRTSIPHLTELQEKYKGDNVVFVGVSSEEVAAVKPFVDEQGEKMDYVVAVDNSRQTNDAYMQAYNQNGIPTAFIVDKEGRVAWLGHPMEMEGPLAAVVDGTYDLEEMVAEQEARVLLQEKLGAFMELLQGGEIAKANEAAKETLETAKDERLLILTGWYLVALQVPEDAEVKPDYQLAQKLIEAGMKVAKEELSVQHAFYSRALFMNGDLNGAIREIDKAIEMEADPGQREQYEALKADYTSEPAANEEPI